MASERRVDPWGRVHVAGADLFELFYRDADLGSVVVQADAQVERFNEQCRIWDKPGERLLSPAPLDCTPAAERARRVAAWQMPARYQDLDVRALLLARCERATERRRIDQEMDLFEARDLLPLLRLMLALIDHWREHGIVWGVGRGSSVASYVLYRIGVHRIDALRYGLDIGEFLR